MIYFMDPQTINTEFFLFIIVPSQVYIRNQPKKKKWSYDEQKTPSNHQQLHNEKRKQLTREQLQDS